MTVPNDQLRRSQVQMVLMICVCLTFFSLPVGTAPLTICSLASLAIWLLSGNCYRNRSDWMGQDWLMPLTALIILPWIGILWSSASFSQALKFAERSHYWLFAFVAARVMTTERALQNVLACFVSGTVFIAIVRFLHFCGIIPRTTYLHKAFYNSYINYSLLIVIAVALLAYFFTVMPTTFNRCAIVVLMLGLVLELSQLNGRSGYLALVLLSPWIGYTMFGKKSLIPFCCGMIVLCALMSASQRVRDRVTQIPSEIKQFQLEGRSSVIALEGTPFESSVGMRLVMWSDALRIFQNHPLLGAGTGAYLNEAKVVNPANKRHHPHNSFLYIAANYGLLGIGLYGWLLL
jgi:O-antigen ligase